MKRILVMVLGMVLVLGMGQMALAQNAEGDSQYEVGMGAVVSKTSDSIVISEYNYNKGTNAKNTYYVDNTTEYDNVGSLDEIKPGDNLQLIYLTKEGKKVAEVVIKEMPQGQEKAASSTTTGAGSAPQGNAETPAPAVSTNSTTP